MEQLRTLDPEQLDHSQAYFLLNSIVVPRPIAWVSTVDAEGRTNLAPHSYFTVAGVQPPTVLFTSIGVKDTISNISATGEFVVNIVPHGLGEQMNVTAADAPHGVSEFELAGLAPRQSEKVAPPGVADAPVSLECRLDRIVPVGEGAFVVLGEVLLMHLAERLFDERDRVAPERLDAIARMSGSTYSTTRDRFDMRRPRYADLMTAKGNHDV